MSALTLVVPLLVAAADDCYLVSNKRIEIIPCNFDPAVIATLLADMEESEPTGPQDARPPQGGTPPPRVQARERPQSGAPSASVQGREPPPSRDPQAMTPGAEPQQSAAPPAVPRSAEPQQSAAPPAVPRNAEPQQSLDATVAELRALEVALASGSAGDAGPVLARAAQAFAAANSPQGAASITEAQQALARSDLYAARQAIAAAIGAAATRR